MECHFCYITNESKIVQLKKKKNKLDSQQPYWIRQATSNGNKRCRNPNELALGSMQLPQRLMET
jgi:negative regulator of replication initiation